MELKEIIKKLLQQRMENELEYIDYVKNRSEIMDSQGFSMDDNDILVFLKDYCPDGERESTAWEAGWIAGMTDAINILYSIKNNAK